MGNMWLVKYLQCLQGRRSYRWYYGLVNEPSLSPRCSFYGTDAAQLGWSSFRPITRKKLLLEAPPFGVYYKSRSHPACLWKKAIEAEGSR
jgi:hypothetical protein